MNLLDLDKPHQLANRDKIEVDPAVGVLGVEQGKVLGLGITVDV